ncbi:transposase [Escherichia coli]|nr:transposase [Escherichia coli]EFH7641055.1 DDE-type integrase/transposase/recombinase [Escherichia coli]EFO2523733.1 transposase [Escherichia coli]
MWTHFDDFNHEALSPEIDLNLPTRWVIRVPDRIPVMQCSDNGPEFISLVLAGWAERLAVKLAFIHPGKPTQNAVIERFYRKYVQR